jgi:hypothetical protein
VGNGRGHFKSRAARAASHRKTPGPAAMAAAAELDQFNRALAVVKVSGTEIGAV